MLRKMYFGRGGFTLVLLATLLGPSPGLGAEKYDFKPMKSLTTGERESIEVSQTLSARVTVIPNGGQPQSTPMGNTWKAKYTVEYLAMEKGKPFTKAHFSIEKSLEQNAGKDVFLGLSGKELIAERRNGKLGYRFTNGDEVPNAGSLFLERLDGSSGGEQKAPSGFNQLLLPKGPVAVGQAWDCDTVKLAKYTMGGFEGFAIDPKRSTGKAKLLKVYEKAGSKFASINLEVQMIIFQSVSAKSSIKFDPPATAKITGTSDYCIDGTSTYATRSFKTVINARGVAKENGQESQVTIYAELTHLHKWTPLKSE